MQLTRVFYTPDTRMNLLSAMRLNELGICVILDEGRAILFDKYRGIEIASGVVGRKLYPIIFDYLPPDRNFCASVAENPVSAEMKLWHTRLGHPSTAVLESLIRSGKI